MTEFHGGRTAQHEREQRAHAPLQPPFHGLAAIHCHKHTRRCAQISGDPNQFYREMFARKDLPDMALCVVSLSLHTIIAQAKKDKHNMVFAAVPYAVNGFRSMPEKP